ncbi:MAG: molybdenum cofactor guanylyltransferase [Chloroflexi bacterium]|nr:molybdenum cofactor guanylyltransferase [Chloroflexota bacterium]
MLCDDYIIPGKETVRSKIRRMSNFSVVINAGGRSSRMGADKAFADIGGKPMIERIIEQTAGLGDQIIVANSPEEYAHLGLPIVADVLPDKGALGGVYTCIHAATQHYVLVTACDMPFVNRPLLEYMMLFAPEFDAVVPRLRSPLPEGEGLGVRVDAEPLRAIYSKACLEPIRRALDSGKMRVISFFPDIRLRWVEEDEIRQFDPELLSFVNCNTPEELDAVRRIWEMRGL